MKEILKDVEEFFTEFPEYIYLIIGIVFLVLFVGVLKNKKWAIDPSSGGQRMFYDVFGHRAFRVVVGVVYLFGSLAGFGGFFFYFTQ